MNRLLLHQLWRCITANDPNWVIVACMHGHQAVWELWSFWKHWVTSWHHLVPGSGIQALSPVWQIRNIQKRCCPPGLRASEMNCGEMEECVQLWQLHMTNPLIQIMDIVSSGLKRTETNQVVTSVASWKYCNFSKMQSFAGFGMTRYWNK